MDSMIPRTTLSPMAMGKRTRQASMWVATQDVPRSAGHPFYTRLNQMLDQYEFDGFVEGCASFLGWSCPKRRRITRRYRARVA